MTVICFLYREIEISFNCSIGFGLSFLYLVFVSAAGGCVLVVSENVLFFVLFLKKQWKSYKKIT